MWTNWPVFKPDAWPKLCAPPIWFRQKVVESLTGAGCKLRYFSFFLGILHKGSLWDLGRASWCSPGPGRAALGRAFDFPVSHPCCRGGGPAHRRAHCGVLAFAAPSLAARVAPCAEGGAGQSIRLQGGWDRPGLGASWLNSNCAVTLSQGRPCPRSEHSSHCSYHQ